MKKTNITLFVLTLLCQTPAFSMDLDEKDSASVVKIKPTKKQVKPSKEAPTEISAGWYSTNNKIKIRYTETREIGDFKGCKLYGYIDPSYTNSRWQRGLDNGFTKTAEGTNGVKINPNLLELKINGNERLYTKKVYKNDLGDYLAIFDRPARHKKMKKEFNKNNFKIYSDCFSNIK